MKHYLYKALLVLMISSWVPIATAETASQALHSYVTSGDDQDVEKLETILHPDFVSNYVFKGKDEVKSLDRSSFLTMFEKKKFGGKQREFTLQSVNESKNLALINARMTSSELVFSGVFILQRVNSTWKLKQEFLIVEPTS